ncbi:MAG: hypothetical protein EXR71_13690 [Myxococcales bacterium]|nr:hypothetical protein [Myxococcales bacterium]
MRALLVGTPGRTPFAGHFRGRATAGGGTIAWAGRVRGAHAPGEAWEAAEAARDALAGLSSTVDADRFALVDAAWAALRQLGAADLSALLVAGDAEGVVVAACGLGEVRADGAVAVPAGHPLYDEPGVRDRPGYFHPEGPVTDWIGVPVGLAWRTEALTTMCGVRSPR